MNKKLTNVLRTNVTLYFICLVLFALAAIPFDVRLAIGEGAAAVLLLIIARRRSRSVQQSMRQYMDRFTGGMDSARSSNMLFAPLPMMVFDADTQAVVWCNDGFLELTEQKEGVFDAHLNAVINKRRAALLDLPIVFRRNDRIDEKVQEHLRSPWFSNFILDILDAKLWGFSLFQFRRDGEWLDYDLIPRKHVDPVRRLIFMREQDITGDSWDEFADLLFVGKPRDLGLLAQVMPYAIYKRNCLGYYAQYTELFGQPLREGTYDMYNDEARRAMLRDLTAMGASGIFLHPEGTELKLHEAAQKAGSAQLYETLLDYCDNAESKALLGNTLTTQTDDTGTQALGTVHKNAEEAINHMDRLYVLNVLNYDMADIFTALGVNVKNGRFEYEQPKNINLEARINIDRTLQAMGLPISDDYLYETYGVERPADYDRLKARMLQDRSTEVIETAGTLPQNRTSGNIWNRMRDFFGIAPDNDPGALEW